MTDYLVDCVNLVFSSTREFAAQVPWSKQPPIQRSGPHVSTSMDGEGTAGATVYSNPSPFDLARARQKREMAIRLRHIALGLSILSERSLFFRDAVTLEAEAAQLERGPPHRGPQSD